MKSITVKMTPSGAAMEPSGVRTVIEMYQRYAWQFSIQFSGEGQVEIVHAGVKPFDDPAGNNIAMLHGLNWTGDYQMTSYEHASNAVLAHSIRQAKVVTVPSEWVANAIRRQTHVDPIVVPHGVAWEEWQDGRRGDYIHWPKNRIDSICSVDPLRAMVRRMPHVKFATTVWPNEPVPRNLKVTGVLEWPEFKPWVMNAGVCLLTVQETFSLAALESMASGVPVCCFNTGHVPHLIEHGVTGYVARNGDLDDLVTGLEYCLAHRDVLGENARAVAKQYTWTNSIEKLREAVEKALEPESGGVTIVIPCFNKEKTIGRTIESALSQTVKSEVIVVDDASTDRSLDIARTYSDRGIQILSFAKNKGVANARNAGVQRAETDYVVCLDGDDRLADKFIEKTLPIIERDRSTGAVYTKILAVTPDGNETVSDWPPEFNYDEQVAGRNQIPTACLFRKEMWRRLGGYRQRYAPIGAGSEDAEFWLRAGAYGWNAVRVAEPLFIYSLGGGVTSREDYVPENWRAWHEWTRGESPPFLSLATPDDGTWHAARSIEPIISVVIPVAEHHVENLINALDSLEAQNFYQWEVIVVADFKDEGQLAGIGHAFPYAKILFTGGLAGAGVARNIGVKASSGELLLFLDADDWLALGCLKKMYHRHIETGDAIYTDYYGVSHVSDNEAARAADKVVHYDQRIGKLVTYGTMADFDCRKALRQPENPPYVWSSVTTLVRRDWHDAVGGFNEELETWEDYLYHITMAVHGICFTRIPEPLFVYNFHLGQRRETGLALYKELDLFGRLQALKGDTSMGCNCNKKKENQVEASNMGTIKVMYYPGRRGKHNVTGISTKERYGYHQQGDIFDVLLADVAIRPSVWRCPDGNPLIINRRDRSVSCPESQVVIKGVPGAPAPTPPPPPRPVGHTDDLSQIRGVSEKTAETLKQHGITTFIKLSRTPDNVLKQWGVTPNYIKRVKEAAAEAAGV